MIPVIAPWSPDAVYSSGPDIGTPTKTIPPYTNFIPGVPVGAQEMNYLLNLRDLATNQNFAHDAIIGASNWKPAVVSTALVASSSFYVPPVWNAAVDTWFAAPWNTGANAFYVTYSGLAWGSYGSGTNVQSQPIAFAAASDGKMAMICTTFGGTTSTHTTSSAVQDDVTIQTFMGGGMTCGILAWFQSQWVFVGGTQSGANFVGIEAGSFTGTGLWADGHTSLPAVWQTSANHVDRMFSCMNESYPGAGDATVIVVGQHPTSNGTDTTRVLKVTASAFTDITPAAWASKSLTGLAYDPSSQLFWALVYNVTQTIVCTSPDLVTWTTVHTFLGADVESPAVLGGVWVAFNNTIGRMLISSDQGVTWGKTQGFSGDIPLWMVSSGTQLVASSAAFIEESLQAGMNKAV